MKFIVPTSTIQTGGSLEDFYYDLLVGRSDLDRYEENGNTVCEGNLILTLGQINQILTAGGEVYEYLLAVRADIALLGDDLPSNSPNVEFPNRQTLDESAGTEVRKFKNWFDSSAEVWKKDTDDEIYFLTNPIGNTIDKYLIGTQIATLFNSFGGGSPSIVDRNLDVDTIAQFEAEIATGWTQVIF
jgi:hypothetical protein